MVRVEYFRSKHEAHASRRESKAAALDIKSPPPVDEEEDVPIQSGKKVGNPFDMLEDGDDDDGGGLLVRYAPKPKI